MEITQIAKKLISYKTTASQKSEVELCMQFIKEYINQNKKIIYREYEKKGVKSILFGFNNITKPDLILCGHIDVVDAKDRQFKSKVRNQKLFGRGAIDMKGSVAVLLYLIRTYQKTDKSFSVLLSSDEEVGGENGVKYVLTQIKPKFAIIAEESGFDLTIKQKGKACLRITTKGISGHGSNPDDNKNAIISLFNAYNAIQDIVKGKSSDGATFNIGVIKGGIANNVIPDEAYFEVDFRFSDKSIFSKKLNELRKRIRNKAKLEVISYSPPMSSGRNSKKYIELLKKILEKYSITPRLKATNYSGDGRYFSERNIPVVEFGPIGANYHADNEYADVKSLDTYYEVLNEFIKNL